MKIYSLVAGLLATSFASAVTIAYSYETDESLVGVTPGTTAIGDGSIVELGFYSTATASDFFSGEWTVFDAARVGDIRPLQLLNIFSGDFVLNTDIVGMEVIGRPLAIRFYDGLTPESSTLFNAVSDPAWVVPATVPSTGPGSAGFKLVIDSSRPLQQSQGGLSFPYETIIPVPEPSAALLLSLGILLGVCKRSRPCQSFTRTGQ